MLLRNDDNLLPLADTNSLNLFGWASTNPVYGGAGSGGINQLFPIVSLRQGLEQSGFSVNDELFDFYKSYAENRAAVSITAQNWNLPEAPVSTYSQEMIDNATNDSNNIRMSAISYTDQLLSNISSIMGNTLSEMGEKFDDFNSSLNRYYNLVNDNRRELAPMEESGVYAIPPQEEEPEEEES